MSENMNNSPYREPDNYDESIDLSNLLNVLKKRKWLIFSIMFLVVFLVMLASFLMKPVYEARSVLVIDKEQGASPVTGERLDIGSYQTQLLTFNTHFKLVTSKPVLTQVVYNLNLDEQAENLETNIISKMRAQLKKNIKLLLNSKEQELTEEQRLDAIIERLSNSIQVKATRDTRLLTISVQNTDPALARQIANELAAQYIQFDVSNRLDASQSNLKWMHNELYGIKKKLEDDEQEFLNYKKTHNVFSIEGKQKVIDQNISEFNNEYLAARNRRVELDAKLAEIEKLYGEGKDVVQLRAMISNDTIDNLYLTLTNLEVELNKLSKVFRSQHPKILQVNSEISKVSKKLEAELERELENIKSERSVLFARENLMLTNIKEFEKDALDAGSKELKYTILKRNVDTNQSLYDTLLAKVKESSLLTSGSASNIRVVEEASLPTAPIKPNKKRNLLLSLVLGLFSGVGLAFLFEYFDQTLRNADDVERVLGLQVLSVVPIADKGTKGSY